MVNDTLVISSSYVDATIGDWQKLFDELPKVIKDRLDNDFPICHFGGLLYINIDRVTDSDIDEGNYREDITEKIKKMVLRTKLDIFLK